MDTVSAKHFLHDQIESKYHRHVPTVLKSAYSAVDLMVKNEPILQVPSAKDNKGRLISWAVDLAFMRLIETGQWPFDCRWVYFERPTGRYLEIRLPHSVMSISQVQDASKQPRNVGFRHNKRLNNQPFFDMEEFADEEFVMGAPHFLMIHGHQDLSFAHLTVPHSVHKFGYIYKTPNLMQIPHELPSELPPVEDTDIEATMTLKEEIEKWRRDHGEG